MRPGDTQRVPGSHFPVRSASAGPAGPVGAQGQGDLAIVRGRAARDHGLVALVDAARLERHRQRTLHGRAAPEQHQAGGGLVEAVHHQRIGMGRLHARGQAVLLVVAASGHAQQPGGLVGHHARRVDVRQTALE